MKSPLYILFSVLIATISACNAYHAPMKVSGIVSCEGDSAALVHPFITRLSDGKLFAGDKKGYYSVIAAKGDSLAFSYVGTISDTIKVTRRRHDVRLKPYIGGDDELIIVDKSNKLKEDLTSLIDSTDARIGVAIILNGKDTISINGTKEFPMMSVFKFPLALTVANVVEANNSSFNEKVKIPKEDLKENTYSPMLKMYGRKDMSMSLRELLEWSLKESDNNAADILLKYVGGIKRLNELMKRVDIPEGITVGASEDDMHRDPYLSYLNLSTPLAMAELFDYFMKHKEESILFRDISKMLETCQTGSDRLVAPLKESAAIIGHKTGTGDSLTKGRISAVNDCGYIILPDGKSYSIAVFIADSAYEMSETSKIIAEISRIIYDAIDTNID